MNQTASSALPGTGRIAPVTGDAAEPGVAAAGGAGGGWGGSGGVVDIVELLCSGREGRDVEDLELHSVRVVEEHCVVAGHVRVFLRLALE